MEDAEAWSRSSSIRGCDICTQRMSIQEDGCQEKEPKKCIEELAASFLATHRVGGPYLNTEPGSVLVWKNSLIW